MFVDERGSLMSIKCPFNVKEILVSCSHRNVFRGFHKSPYEKYIYVKNGIIRDIIVYEDGSNEIRELRENDTLLIPANVAHGFYAISDCELIYFLGGEYDPYKDRNIFWKSPDIHYIDLPDDVIISQKDKNSGYMKDYDFLLLGGKGYLGSNFAKYANCLIIHNRLEDIQGIAEHIQRSKIKHVVCAAGISKIGSTTEWCEKHEEETKKVNYTDVIRLMDLCESKNVHLTYFGSCMNSGDTVYSRWRRELEKSLKPNVLYLKFVYPCTFDGNERCFKTKMKNRIPDNKRVSLTIVDDLFPLLPDIIKSGATGSHNIVNEGTIHVSEFCETYAEEYYEPSSLIPKIPVKNYLHKTNK